MDIPDKSNFILEWNHKIKEILIYTKSVHLSKKFAILRHVHNIMWVCVIISHLILIFHLSYNTYYDIKKIISIDFVSPQMDKLK